MATKKRVQLLFRLRNEIARSDTAPSQLRAVDAVRAARDAFQWLDLAPVSTTSPRALGWVRRTELGVAGALPRRRGRHGKLAAWGSSTRSSTPRWPAGSAGRRCSSWAPRPTHGGHVNVSPKGADREPARARRAHGRLPRRDRERHRDGRPRSPERAHLPNAVRSISTFGYRVTARGIRSRNWRACASDIVTGPGGRSSSG
jgi:hypothetical protein